MTAFGTGSYEEVTDWLYQAETGNIKIRLRVPESGRYVKVHCTYDERDYDNNYVDTASLTRNAAGTLITVNYLVKERTETYTYDAKGNRLTRTIDSDVESEECAYTYYENADRVMTDGKYGYRYDANGNLIGKGKVYTAYTDDLEFSTSEGEVWAYTYDLFNRLVEVRKSETGTGSLATLTTYLYDHRGLRVLRTNSAGTVTRYSYSPQGKVLSEETNDVTTDYIYLGSQLMAKTVDGVTITDHQGSTIMLTDLQGTPVWNEGYTAFGEKTGETGYDLSESGRYTGKDYDEDTGLYYYNARWYDPSLGRFITEDPAKDGLNWYVYVRNNPLNRIDPTGLREIVVNDQEGKPVVETEIDRYQSELQKDIAKYDKKIEGANSPGEAEKYRQLQYGLMSEYNNISEYNSQAFVPGSKISQGFLEKQERMESNDGTYLSYTHSGNDLVNGKEIVSPGYYKVISTTDGLVLERIGTDVHDRLLHLNPEDLATLCPGQILSPGEKISNFPGKAYGDPTTGPHVHIEETRINDTGVRGFVNPDTHDMWTSRNVFNGVIERNIFNNNKDGSYSWERIRDWDSTRPR